MVAYLFPLMAGIFFLLALSRVGNALPPADKVVVKKSEARLYLLHSGKVIKSYHIALGRHPEGPKHCEGDGRTPEGTYVLDYKKVHSRFYRAIHISYPNKADRERAKKLRINPGGGIMIHGQKNGWAWLSPLTQYFNWTQGCIAVTNREMDEIWRAVKIGTPIVILP